MHPPRFSGELHLPTVPFGHFLEVPLPRRSAPVTCPPGPLSRGPVRPPRLASPPGARPLRSRRIPFGGFCGARVGWLVSPGPSPLLPITFLPRHPPPALSLLPPRTRAHLPPPPARPAAAARAALPAPRSSSPRALPARPAAGAGPRAAPCYSGYCV